MPHLCYIGLAADDNSPVPGLIKRLAEERFQQERIRAYYTYIRTQSLPDPKTRKPVPLNSLLKSAETVEAKEEPNITQNISASLKEILAKNIVMKKMGLGGSGQDEQVKADSEVKRIRQKRGHYRTYNSDKLNEAIQAVKRGEMSVHRAGSYFGVPHSTLEYKVKGKLKLG